MAVKIDSKVFLSIAKNIFNVGGSFQPSYIKLGGVKVDVTFSQKSQYYYIVKLNQPVMFPIQSGVTISDFIVGGGSGNNDKFKIVLEGEEVVVFEKNGTYVINSLEIKVGE